MLIKNGTVNKEEGKGGTHGERWFFLRFRSNKKPHAKSFKYLPERMAREHAKAYYGKKLNKIWKELGYV